MSTVYAVSPISFSSNPLTHSYTTLNCSVFPSVKLAQSLNLTLESNITDIWTDTTLHKGGEREPKEKCKVSRFPTKLHIPYCSKYVYTVIQNTEYMYTYCTYSCHIWIAIHLDRDTSHLHHLWSETEYLQCTIITTTNKFKTPHFTCTCNVISFLGNTLINHWGDTEVTAVNYNPTNPSNRLVLRSPLTQQHAAKNQQLTFP